MQKLQKNYPLILKNDYIRKVFFHLQAYTKQINQEFLGISFMVELLELKKNKKKSIQVYCLKFFPLRFRVIFEIIFDCKDNQLFCIEYAVSFFDRVLNDKYYIIWNLKHMHFL